MKRLFVVALALFTVACSDRTTGPTKARAFKNECLTRDPSEECDRPSIDSISPSSGVFGLYPPTTVCVYGVSLEGGTVYFDGAPMTTTISSDGCGNVQFDAPMNRPGTYPVYLVAPAGTTNTVYFLRTIVVPDRPARALR